VIQRHSWENTGYGAQVSQKWLVRSTRIHHQDDFGVPEITAAAIPGHCKPATCE
jgi:hypothetical protein